MAHATGAAAHAAHLIGATVQVDDSSRAGTLVQAIHVLGDHPAHLAQRLEPGQGTMRRIGSCLAQGTKAHQGTRPVALPGGVTAHELAMLHGRRALPLAGIVAVVGNAAGGADPGTAENRQSRMAHDEIDERLQVRLAFIAYR